LNQMRREVCGFSFYGFDQGSASGALPKSRL
jgi:hypothetical protein